MPPPKKLVLDCDPGLDDAIAILAAAYHADLVGITTVAGNVGINRTTRNALVVAQIAGLDVPVHRGAAQPLAGAPVDGSRIHGATGLGDSVLPNLARAEASDDAVTYLCDTARSVDDLHLLAIGPHGVPASDIVWDAEVDAVRELIVEAVLAFKAAIQSAPSATRPAR